MENFQDSPYPPYQPAPVPEPPRPFYNKFLEAGREGKNEWWRYLLGVILSFIGGYSIIGAIPLLVLVLIGIANKDFSLAQLQANSTNAENPSFLHVDANVLLPCLLFIFVAAMFFLWLAVRFIHKKRFMAIIASERKPFDFKRYFSAFFIWMLFSVVFFSVGYFLDHSQLHFVFQPVPFIITVVICLLMLPIQTGWEEVFLRGYIMQGFGLMSESVKKIYSDTFQKITTHKSQIPFGIQIILFIKILFFGMLRLLFKHPVLSPLIITSVIFGLLHMANAEVKANGVLLMLPQYIFPGLMFGMIALMDERLEVSMGLHFANNLFGICLVTSPDMSVQAHTIWSTTTTSGGFLDFIVSTVPLLLAFVVLWRMYKWDFKKLYRAY